LHIVFATVVQAEDGQPSEQLLQLVSQVLEAAVAQHAHGPGEQSKPQPARPRDRQTLLHGIQRPQIKVLTYLKV
jgi:hypothetical protein